MILPFILDCSDCNKGKYIPTHIYKDNFYSVIRCSKLRFKIKLFELYQHGKGLRFGKWLQVNYVSIQKFEIIVLRVVGLFSYLIYSETERFGP